MNEPLISLIIPVYNVKDYLERCIDSVLKQTYKNIEILVVDDGSTDGSGEICDEYAKRDSRIKVIHKVNGGLSDARNAALDVMMGDYVACLDSDDWLAEDYLSYLYKLLSSHDADMAISQFKKVYSDNDKLDNIPEEITVFNSEDAIESFLYQKRYTASAHCKLYKRRLFDEIRYPKGRYYEDLAIICQLLHLTEKVVISNQQKYYYLQRKNSIMSENFNVKKMDRISNAEMILDYIKKTHPNIVTAAEFRLFLSAVHTFREIPKGKEFDEYRQRCWVIIKAKRKMAITNLSVGLFNRIIALASFLGIRFFYVLGRLYSKVMM